MKWYRQALGRFFNHEINWQQDQLTWTLHSSAYVPNLDTHATVADLNNELATGGGYTAGGILVAGPTRAYTVANSWLTVRANTTAYLADDVVIPAAANGFLYRCTVAGTTAGAPPVFPTVVGTTVVDGGVTWECAGSGIQLLGTGLAQWTNATFTARYLVLSDRTPVGAANQPLIAVEDFGSNQTGLGTTFSVSWPNNAGQPLTGLYALIG